MADFRDCCYDRVNTIARQLEKATSPDNPARSPSTKKNLVDQEIKPLVCELLALYELLGRTP